MSRLRVASTNANKLRELREMLEPLGYRVDGIEALGLDDIIEDGDTFAANAIIKARAARCTSPRLTDQTLAASVSQCAA